MNSCTPSASAEKTIEAAAPRKPASAAHSSVICHSVSCSFSRIQRRQRSNRCSRSSSSVVVAVAVGFMA